MKVEEEKEEENGEREDKREEGGVEGAGGEGKRSLVSIGLCKDH